MAVIGSQWQSNFYRSIITTRLSAAGAKTNSALPTILSWPFLESLEFLEILRREIVLYSGENIRIHVNRLITLPWVNYYPAKPTPQKPRPWRYGI